MKSYKSGVTSWIPAFAGMTILSIASIVFAATPAQNLAKILTGFHAMQADFVQIVSTDKADIIEKSNGKMALQRPGKFYWYVQKPNEQLIIADGKNIWVYDADLNQVMKRKMDYDQPFSPAMLLSGSVRELQQRFMVTRLSNFAFKLIPKNKSSEFRSVILQFAENKLKEMHIVDNLGQNSVLIFSKVKINQRIKASLFKFRPSAGVEVVDGG